MASSGRSMSSLNTADWLRSRLCSLSPLALEPCRELAGQVLRGLQRKLQRCLVHLPAQATAQLAAVVGEGLLRRLPAARPLPCCRVVQLGAAEPLAQGPLRGDVGWGWAWCCWAPSNAAGLLWGVGVHLQAAA